MGHLMMPRVIFVMILFASLAANVTIGGMLAARHTKPPHENKRPPMTSDITDWQDILAHPDASQEATLTQTQEATRIKTAVQSLPENQRIAVVLCYFEGLTNPEAAHIMELHVGALEGLLVRARKQLRMNLEDCNEQRNTSVA